MTSGTSAIWSLDATRMPSSQSCRQACSQQRIRQGLDTGRPEPEHRWRFDNRVAAIHGLRFDGTKHLNG